MNLGKLSSAAGRRMDMAEFRAQFRALLLATLNLRVLLPYLVMNGHRYET
jgi:hypothetical protein